MKHFSKFRTQLNETPEPVEENIGHMPPNILILRRQSVRQFPDHTMVALYYNDKLDQHFSIPYGSSVTSVVTPTALKEATWHQKKSGVSIQHPTSWSVVHDPPHQGRGSILHKSKEDAEAHMENLKTVNPEAHRYSYILPPKSHSVKEEAEQLDEINMGKGDHAVLKAFLNKKPASSKKLSTDGKRLDGNWLGGSGIAHHSDKGVHLNDLGSRSAQQVHRAIKKHNSYESHSDVPHHTLLEQEEVVEEGAIDHLRKVVGGHARSSLKHKDGRQTMVDPTTAKALLTVHDALKPEHQAKFAEHLEKSKPTFHKMLDFTWKNVS